MIQYKRDRGLVCYIAGQSEAHKRTVPLCLLAVSVASGAFGGFIGGDGLDAKSLEKTWNAATDAITREARRTNRKYALKETAKHAAKKVAVRTSVRSAMASSAAVEVSIAFAKRKFGY